MTASFLSVFHMWIYKKIIIFFKMNLLLLNKKTSASPNVVYYLNFQVTAYICTCSQYRLTALSGKVILTKILTKKPQIISIWSHSNWKSAYYVRFLRHTLDFWFGCWYQLRSRLLFLCPLGWCANKDNGEPSWKASTKCPMSPANQWYCFCNG